MYSQSCIILLGKGGLIMNQQQCAEIGEKLVRRFKTRDPFVIADGLGIQVYDNCEMGDLKGFYKVIKRNR